MSKKANPTIGVLCFLSAMALVVFLATIVKKTITRYGISVEEAVFVRATFILLFSLPMMLKDKPFSVKKEEFKLNIFRNLLFAISTFLWYRGVVSTSLNNAVVISFLTPVLSTILSVFILKERLSFVVFSATLLCTGVTLWLKKVSLDITTISFVFLFSAVIMRGFVNIFTKKLTSKGYSTRNIVHYNSLLMWLTSLSCILTWKPIPLECVLWLSFAGLIYFVETYLQTLAYKHCTVSQIQPLDFSRIVFSMLISYLVLSEYPTSKQIIAACIIIFANLTVILFATQKNKSHK
jgi:drug/metabolite transporter (DMT)-like permease